jgi:hypothetical protein
MGTLSVLKLFPSRVLERVTNNHHQCPRPRDPNGFTAIEEPQYNKLLGIRSSSCTVRVNICCVPCHANFTLPLLHGVRTGLGRIEYLKPQG